MERSRLLVIGILIIFILVMCFLINSVLNPPKASDDDVLFEDIGGDDFLNVTLKSSLKTGEKNIPDGSFKTSFGKIGYYDAKNITYADTSGHTHYLIVWKTTPDKYSWVNISKKVNQYVSCYLKGDVKGKCFVEYSYENNYVYGVMLSTESKSISESEFIYDILGLNKDGFDLVYSSSSSGYSGSSSGSHYHTVVSDRYTLSRTDPGAYYDHYEYGDNYAIDDYLESQGYD